MTEQFRGKGRLYCFSPPVMLATFILEIAFIVYIVVRYKMTSLSRLVVSLLFFLAVFQLAEYNVCGGLGLNAAAWSRLGFVMITMLPPIGIHLAHVIAGKGWNKLTAAAYGTALAWVATFAFSERAFAGHVCAGNYVIFQIKPVATFFFFAFYYFWLFLGVYLCFRFARSAKLRKVRESLYLLGLGYLSFMLPTALANTINPKTIDGIPSIMCGFAIILAGLVVFGIMPRMAEQKSAVQSRKTTHS